jgi:glycosyltransferase involved in cell wall biosynthesis
MSSFKSPTTVLDILRLARFMRREKVEIVHNYLLRANVIGTIAARLAGVRPVLCSKRGCHERRGLELIGARLSNSLATCVTANAEAVRDFVHVNEGCPKEKMVVIPTGVDTERFHPLAGTGFKERLGLDPSKPVVGTVTRMRVRKGVEEFLRAMASVLERRSDAQAVIVGDVSLDEDLQRLVDSTVLRDRLRLLGRRDDMPEVLSAVDVFVLSSHDEGMSAAILEAMAMQLPVIATDVGGTAEVVRRDKSGILVPPRDPEPLAQAVEQLLADRQRREAMGRLGRQIVEQGFSVRVMVRRIETLYLDLSAPHRSWRSLGRAVGSASARVEE